jgi:hypothetical protein
MEGNLVVVIPELSSVEYFPFLHDVFAMADSKEVLLGKAGIGTAIQRYGAPNFFIASLVRHGFLPPRYAPEGFE